MKRIQAYLPENLVNRLDQTAKQTGVPRSEVIRNLLDRSACSNTITPDDLHKTVAKIRQRYSYGLDRQQAESVVAAVVSELFNYSKNDQTN